METPRKNQRHQCIRGEAENVEVPENKENTRRSDLESDVQMSPSESGDSDAEFADLTHPESELVSDMLSESAHAKLDIEGFTLPLDRRGRVGRPRRLFAHHSSPVACEPQCPHTGRTILSTLATNK